MRTRTLQAFFTILFILVGSCLYYLQIIKGPFYNNLSSRNSIRLLNINAPRGNIYDRNGKLVAGNALSFGVFIIPQEVIDMDDEMGRLADILGVSKSVLERNYKRNKTASFAPCELIRGVSKKAAIAIEEARLDIPGIIVKEIPVRNYYYKEVFSHVTGYVGEISELELELLKPYGYSIRDFIGKDGVERFCDRVLRGKNGGMQIQVDNRGRQVKVMSYRKPRNGRDVYLTLDAGLQKQVYNLFGGQKGAAIFMDPRNGEILSLVSCPGYNPNEPLLKAMRMEDAPLLNRAIMGLYPAGSIFKIITIIAGLESKSISPETTFLCPGKMYIGRDEFDCWNKDGHGEVSLEYAIAWSCNVYLYHTGLATGVDRISEWASAFGLGKKTGIELFGEAKGFVPTKEWKRTERKEAWYPGDTANFSIGQGALLVTPLQLARVAGAIANGGSLVRPHILKLSGDAEESGFKAEDLKIGKETLYSVRRGMRKTVSDPDGTGNEARSDIVSISAKTGTVQVGPGIAPHGWFVGFAPSENPRICFAVFAENGGSGGDLPADIAKSALEYWFRNKQ